MDINDKFPNAYLILLGDFNSRIGSDLGYYCRKALVPKEFVQSLHYWSSRDQGRNQFGERFIALMYQTDLRPIGASQDLHQYPFTFHSTSVSSSLDYICIPKKHINLFSPIKVTCTEMSDHQMISTSINLANDLRSISESRALYMANLTAAPPKRLKWGKVDIDRLNDFFKSPVIKEYQVMLNDLDPVRDGSKLAHVYESVCCLLIPFLTSPNHCNLPPSQPEWFDRECRQQRSSLRRIMRRAQFNPNPLLNKLMLTTRRNYKSLIKKKKTDYISQIWHSLNVEAKVRNSHKFWPMLSYLLKDKTGLDPPPIAAEQWEAHFRTIYRTKPTVRNFPVSRIETTPHWPPVQQSEIIAIIKTLKPGKAPGNDLLPPELFKSYKSWWAPLLAKLFTSIDCTGVIPIAWTQSIIVPLYKKGIKTDPRNYRPISLLNIVGKLYAHHLLRKLEDWVIESDLLAEEQAGFRPSRSIIDNCFILSHLIDKVKRSRGSLFTAFIDLTAAFDSINRDLLWGKLYDMGIEQRLLLLLMAIHKNPTARIRTDLQGRQTSEVTLSSGVRQGCVLSPLLFNMFINDLPGTLLNPSFHAPKIGGRTISCLLYADDVILLSYSQIGLRRLLVQFSSYCTLNDLTPNPKKSKVLVFRHHPHRQGRHCWKLGNSAIEQVDSFKYLGMQFTPNGLWSKHVKHQGTQAASRAQLLTRLIFTHKPNTIIPAIRAFNSKILPIITFGAEIWGISYTNTLEITQNKFLRLLLGTSPTTQDAALRSELGQFSVESHARARSVYYWLRLLYMDPARLPKLCFEEQKGTPGSWYMKVMQYCNQLGFSEECLIWLGEEAKTCVKQRIRDISSQNDLSRLAQSKSHKWLAVNKRHFGMEKYLITPLAPVWRRAYTRARFEQMDSEILAGRFRGTPYDLRTCICGSSDIENLIHIILACPIYEAIRGSLLNNILTKVQYSTVGNKLRYLLNNQNPRIIGRVGKFVREATILRQKFLESNAIDCREDMIDTTE